MKTPSKLSGKRYTIQYNSIFTSKSTKFLHKWFIYTFCFCLKQNFHSITCLMNEQQAPMKTFQFRWNIHIIFFMIRNQNRNEYWWKIYADLFSFFTLVTLIKILNAKRIHFYTHTKRDTCNKNRKVIFKERTNGWGGGGGGSEPIKFQSANRCWHRRTEILLKVNRKIEWLLRWM